MRIKMLAGFEYFIVNKHENNETADMSRLKKYFFFLKN